MERHIGIDPSLSSTAVCIMDDKEDKFHCFTTAKLTNKWVKAMSQIATIHAIFYGGNKGAYSDSEITKLQDYRNNAYYVVNSLDLTDSDRVYIEGYANRAKGAIIDLVVFGTFIRERIVDTGAHLTIVTPGSLKKNWAEAIYPKDKRGVARNYELSPNSKGEMMGVAGGSFKKHQMMLGLYEMEDNSRFKREMELYRDEIMPLKSIPSPFDDCVDAFAAAYLGKMGRI